MSDKEQENTDVQENEEELGKRRVTWTNDLHLEFVRAVDMFGVTRATPAKLLKVLDGKGLDKSRIASHLQKYRDHMKGKQRDTNQKGIQNVRLNTNEKQSIFNSGPKETIAKHKAELCLYEKLRSPSFSLHHADGKQASSQVHGNKKKREQDDSQKGIKLTVEITLHGNSSNVDSMPEYVINRNVYKTRMPENDHIQAVSKPPNNAAGTQVEMNGDRVKDESSDGHKRSHSNGENMLEKQLVCGNEPEGIMNRETINMWVHDSEPITNIDMSRDLMSEYQPGVKTTTKIGLDQDIEVYIPLLSNSHSEWANIILDVERIEKVNGNSSTIGYSDKTISGHTSNFTNLMSDDSFLDFIWADQGTETEEYIQRKSLSQKNNVVPFDMISMKPDENINSVPTPSCSEDVNEHLGPRGNENPKIMSHDAANNEISIDSEVNNADDLELLQNLQMKTFLYILSDNK